MKKLTYILTIAIFILTASIPAFAVSENEATEIKAAVTSYINNLKTSYNNSPNVNVEYDGDVKVTPKDNYYEIILPKISFGVSNPQNPADEFLTIIDPVVINTFQIDEDTWSASFSIPSPITAMDGNDKEVMKIKIGSQKASAMFMPKLMTATKYNLSYGNIIIDNLIEKDIKVKIDEIVSSLNLEKQASGFWSGPVRFKVKNTSVVSNDLNLKIDDISVNGSYTDFDIDAMRLLSEKALKIDPLTATDAEKKELTDSYLKAMTQSTGGMSANISLNSMSGTYIDEKNKEQIQRQFSIGNIGMGFTANQLRTDTANISFSFNLNALSLPPMDNADTNNIVKAVLPHNIEIDTVIQNIPIQKILTEVVAVNTGTSTPNGLANQAIQSIVDAGTEIKINKNNFQSKDIDFITNGSVKASPTAILKVIADVTLKIRNLDNIIAKYSAPGVLPQQFQQVIAMATMLQMVGVPETNAKGENIRSYRFQLTEDGKMMLNGSDMGALLGSGMAGGIGRKLGQPPMQGGGEMPQMQNQMQAPSMPK